MLVEHGAADVDEPLLAESLLPCGLLGGGLRLAVLNRRLCLSATTGNLHLLRLPGGVDVLRPLRPGEYGAGDVGRAAVGDIRGPDSDQPSVEDSGDRSHEALADSRAFRRHERLQFRLRRFDHVLVAELRVEQRFVDGLRAHGWKKSSAH